jgi:hypothetical protein
VEQRVAVVEDQLRPAVAELPRDAGRALEGVEQIKRAGKRSRLAGDL